MFSSWNIVFILQGLNEWVFYTWLSDFNSKVLSRLHVWKQMGECFFLGVTYFIFQSEQIIIFISMSLHCMTAEWFYSPGLSPHSVGQPSLLTTNGRRQKSSALNLCYILFPIVTGFCTILSALLALKTQHGCSYVYICLPE